MVQLVVGIVEFVVGFLLIAFYAVNVSTVGGQVVPVVTAIPTVLLPLATLAFVFGILSLAASLLALVSERPTRQAYAPQDYVRPAVSQTFAMVEQVPAQTPTPTPAPEVSRTEVGRTILERTSSWSEWVCGQCGRDVQESANFCDRCGSRFQPSERLGHEIRP